MVRFLFVLCGLLGISNLFATTFSVTNTNSSGAGSLPEAVGLANADNSASELAPHLIEFSSLSIADNQIIVLDQLQVIRPMLIDGSTHSSGGITLDANGANIVIINVFGLPVFTADPAGSRLNNLFIINSASNGINMDNVSNINLQNCNVGVEADGITPGANVNGVFLFNGTSDVLLDNCIISGNSSNGLLVEDAVSEAITAVNCKIGVDITGNTAVPNNSNGVRIVRSSSSIVLSDNVIAGNISNGVIFDNSSNGVLKGNFIGLGLDGTTELGNNANGIELLNSSSITIGGNAKGDRNFISSNSSNGVRIASSFSNTILGNFIGTDISGSSPRGNFQGVSIQGVTSIDNVIGDSTFLGRNIISANESHGVFFELGSNSNEVYGNYIGTDSTGLVANGNGRNGVSGTESGSLLIGGLSSNKKNIISGNGFNAFLPDEGPYFSGISFTSSTDLSVKANYIGLGADGVTIIPNANYGIWYNISDNLEVGGETAGERNVISGNGSLGLNPESSQNVSPEEQSSRGVYVFDGENISISGNYIGTDYTGTIAKPNLSDGVVIINSSNIEIGGTEEKANLISGNTFTGLYLFNSTNATVSHNLLGLDATGLLPLSNGYDGLYLQSQDSTVVSDNYISGNTQTGIHIFGGEYNQILNNNIGMGTDDLTSIGNVDGGIRIVSTGENSSLNVLKGNVIHGTTGADLSSTIGDGYGVYVGGTGSFQNIITENSISCNSGLPINLQLSGTNFNTGQAGNIGKEAPFIDPSISNTTITQGLGLPGDTIEIYSNPTACGCDAEIFLGKSVVGTDSTWTLSHSALDPAQVSAIARDLLGNTSEVACKQVEAGVISTVTPDCEGKEISIVINNAVSSSLIWQISQSIDFSTMIVDSSTSSANPATFNFTPQNDNPYFVRVISVLSASERDTSSTISWTAIENEELGDLQLSGSSSVCSGIGRTISIQNDVSSSYSWFDSTASSTWRLLTETSSSIFVNPELNTYYRAVPNGSSCVSVTDTALIEVIDTVFSSVLISVDTNDICSGTSQVFTAEVKNAGVNASYEWFVNDVSSGNLKDLTRTFSNGDNIYLVVVPDTTCPSQDSYESNSIAVVSSQSGELGELEVSGDLSVCSGMDVTISVENNIATGYRWFDSTSTNVWTELVGSSGSSLTVTPDENTYYRVIPSTNIVCITPSDTVLIDVTDTVFVSITVDLDDNDVCSGTTQTFTSYVENAGAGATYEWYLNDNVISSDSIFSEELSNGDIVYLVVTPDTLCASQPSYTSESFEAIVNITGVLTVDLLDYTKCLSFTNDSLKLNAETNDQKDALNYEWFVNGVAQSNNSASFTYLPNEGDTVLVNARSSNACLVSNSVSTPPVVVEFSESVIANAGDDLVTSIKEIIVLDGSGSINSTSFSWFELISNSEDLLVDNMIYSTTVEKTYAEYILKASNEFCEDYDTLIVTATRDEIFIPNAFSPNGDSNHDNWEITNIDFYNDVEISVYNVWGSLVFNQTGSLDDSSVWDGTRNGEQLPVGTYYYVIKLNDGSEDRSGYVNILK